MKYFQNLLLLGIIFPTIILSQSIEIPHKMMNQDTTLNIPIFIYDVSELESIQLTIEYDESIVLVEDIIVNPVGILDAGYTFNSNLTEPGIIIIAIGSNAPNVFSGNGMVAQITFQSIGELGEFSTLTFLDAQINSDWQISAVNGSIEIILDELTITGQDDLGIGAEHTITLGMCDGCIDDWKFGEDEYDYPDPVSGEYTNINFYHLDWFGLTDINGNTIVEYEFSSDFRSQHSFRELISWPISGSTGGGLSPDIDINISWDSGKLMSNSDNFKMFIYVGDAKYNMQELDNISVIQSDLNLVNSEPNIWVKIGECSDTGEASTYYRDFDGDGLGSGTSRDYCFGFVPEDGWVTNSDDGDDYCYSNVYDCSNPPVCDGTAVEDCNGECGGSASEDDCGVCNGDNSFCTDCDGVTNGEAYIDGCGNCVGGNTGNLECPFDCSGEPGGSMTLDFCDTCDNDSSNDCVQDCSGYWGGELVYDECGVCGGPGSTAECGCNNIPDGDCDCNGNKIDDCGICGGDNSICTDCHGDINGEAFLDACGDCVAGNTGKVACTYDCFGDPGGLSIFDECGVCDGPGILEGECDCEGNIFDECGICGGDGIPDSDCDCEGNIFDECGICGGGGILDGNCTCEGNLIDDCGYCVGIDVDYYNQNQDDFGTCCSLDEKDECGECYGTGILPGKCNCEGEELDCLGNCGGDKEKDACGVCNGDNSSCKDCNGDMNGSAYMDGCNICVSGNTGNSPCILDCLGEEDGLANWDNCGNCDENSDNDCVQDCTGIWEGTASMDECDICTGGTSGIEPCIEDCNGILGGTFWVSDCGCVEADNSGDDCDDCAEIPNGTAELDLCGNCIEDFSEVTFVCEPDCDGIYGGNHPPTFSCENGNIACNFDGCFDLANDDFLIPQRFNISRIYPNPFNPQATIDFEVSEPTMVQLNIYNLKGQKVDVLKNAFTLPGHYSVIWNGTNHPSGIYFVILHSSNSIVKQKMMLIK